MKDKDKTKEQLIDELNQLRKRFAELEEEEVNELTGLHSRHYFFHLAEHEFARAHRYERPLSAAMLDIDDFEEITKTYGDAIGDLVLAIVAECCRSNVRYVDVLGRYGGGEFVVMLPESDLADVKKIVERIRKSVEGTPIPIESVPAKGGPLVITVSIGVADLSRDTPNLVVLLERANKALDFARQSGGDRVEVG